MSSRGNGKDNGGGGASSSPPMPASTRKMVQSLKEVVNCPEQEIYAALKDCNMDPDDAINRLLSQDPFREVKSKREKKKENKDTGESRPRGINSNSNRGNKGGMDRYVGRVGSHQFSSPESGVSRGKPPYKKDNGSSSYSTSFSSTSLPVNYLNQQPPAIRDHVPIENNISTIVSCDGISSSSQPPSGVQSAWLAVPGQVSMADIVKMGRTHGKASTDPYQSQQSVNNNHHVLASTSAASHHDLHMTRDYTSKVSELNSEPAVAISQYVLPRNDEWPSVEQPSAASLSSLTEPASDSELYAEPFNIFPIDRTSQHIGSQSDEVWGSGDGTVDNFNSNTGSAPISSLNINGENSEAASLLDNNLYENMNSYQPQRHNFEFHEDTRVSVSSAVDNMRQLSLQDDQLAGSEEDSHCVKIPAHLQVQTEHLSHLSFGSFGSGINAGISGLASQPLKNEEACSAAAVDAVDASSIGHSDTRNSEYYGDENLRATSDGNIVHRSSSSAGIYDSASVPEPKALKVETHEDAHSNPCTFPATVYNHESTQHSNPAFAHSQSSSQMPDHASFSNAYSNALPSTLLASTARPVRESDFAYAPFPKAHSLPSKYNTMSSIGGPTINIQEALRTSNFSSPQPAQTMPGTNVAPGPAPPQHPAVHSYSQPNLPVGHYANMIGYPFLPQSYAYLPSAFQQAFSGTSSYHQSLVAALPQYKNNASVSSLSQSAAVASGYGAFGGSTSIPGNFLLNPPTASTGMAMGYDNIINSRYKDGNSFISTQQNEKSGMWLHGLGSRAASSVPASTYYNYQGQNLQATGFQQSRQLTQHGGNLGHPNFFHSQAGISLEHHQNPRDTFGGSQGQQSNQSKQIWQNSY